MAKYTCLLSTILFLFLAVHADGETLFKFNKIAVSQLPEHIIAPDLKSVALDADGNVFTFAGKIHCKECFIVKFDKNLKYIARFGRYGNGPGEFSAFNSGPEERVSVDPGGDVYIMEYNPRKFLVYGNDGKYKKDIAYYRDHAKNIGRIFESRRVGKNTFAAKVYRGKSKPYHGVIFSLEPERIKVKYEFIEEPKRITSYIEGPFYGPSIFIADDGRHVVFSHSNIYKSLVYDLDGNLVLTIEDKNRVKGKFSKKEMDFIIREHYTPRDIGDSIQNQILRQLVTDKNRFRAVLNYIENGKNVIIGVQIDGNAVYIFEAPADITVRDRFPVSVFDLKGNILRRGYFPEIPALIRDNFVYTYARDEEDAPVIVKHRLISN